MRMKGISLVALIITIIVLIILTATVIILFKDGGIIDKAKETTFKNDITIFREELLQYVLATQLETLNTFDKTTLTKTSYNEIKEIIKSFTQKYENKVIIYRGEIAVDITKLDEKETEWAEGLNLSELSSSISNGIVPNEAKAIKNYRIYGNSVQDGTPTPTNPVEVVSLGEEGTIDVKSKEKNLFNLDSKSINNYGIKSNGVLQPDGSYRIKPPTFNFFSDSTTLPIDNNVGQCTITIKSKMYSTGTGDFYKIGFRYTDGTYSYSSSISNTDYEVITLTSNLGKIIQGIGFDYKGGGATVWMDILYLQVEEGAIATNYEPYQEITTTIDLTGYEPLRKIGDVADYIDYESGKIVRSVGKIELTGENDERWNLSKTSTYSHNLVSIANADVREEFKCNYYEYSIMYNTNCFWIDSSGETLRITSMQHLSTENFKNWIAEQYSKGIPVIVYYKLKKPIEEDIVLPKLPDNAKQINVMPSGSVQPSNVEIEYYM